MNIVVWELDFPGAPEDVDIFIHRVGGTMRYGKGGRVLVVLLSSEEEGMVGRMKERGSIKNQL